jgi:hypothetical protein
MSPIDFAFCGERVWPVVSIWRADCVSVRRGTLWVPPAPGKMPTFTSGNAIFTFSESAATRPWQASANSNAPPMQVPLIAATHGLPQVSSLRQTPVIPPAPSNNACVAFSRSLLLSRANSDNSSCSIFRSAPPEKESLPEVITAPLISASLVTCSTILSISRNAPSSNTFIERPGISQVTRAIPSASTSILKFL